MRGSNTLILHPVRQFKTEEPRWPDDAAERLFNCNYRVFLCFWLQADQTANRKQSLFALTSTSGCLVSLLCICLWFCAEIGFRTFDIIRGNKYSGQYVNESRGELLRTFLMYFSSGRVVHTRFETVGFLAVCLHCVKIIWSIYFTWAASEKVWGKLTVLLSDLYSMLYFHHLIIT